MPRPVPSALLALAVALAVAPLARAADIPTYRTPPKVVSDILGAPRVPRGAPSVSPEGTRMLLGDQPTLIPIATLRPQAGALRCRGAPRSAEGGAGPGR